MPASRVHVPGSGSIREPNRVRDHTGRRLSVANRAAQPPASAAWTANQFDALIHIDETSALEPTSTSRWEAGELPETYPFAV
ncbi:hypothetical protein [Nocardia sp. NPDC004750]